MGAKSRGEPDRFEPGSGPASAGEHLVSPALVSRDSELARLVAAVAAPPVVVVVEGEAGVGKTRLVEELQASPELPGHRWLTGRCRQIREPFPLGAVIEAVRGLGAELRDLPLGPVAGALRPLVPELAQWLPDTPEPLDDRQAERHRVFRGLAELLTALARTRPVVLVVEDVHWADGQTHEFIGYWLSSPRPGVALVITYRSEDASAEVSALTARLPRPVGYEHVTLAPLDEPSTGALTAAILGIETVSAEFAAYLQERTGGLPLAIEEVLALVRARGLLVNQGGRWARKALEQLDVPRGIRDPTLQRVARLPGPARRAVEAAAVLQVASPLRVLLATAGRLRGPGGPIAAIEQALGSGLLVEQGELIGFRHVLAAEAVRDSLSGLRRRELHARAAASLRGVSPAPLGRIAHHLKHAEDPGGWADAAEEAAGQAIALGHEEEATRLLTEVLAGAPLTPQRRAAMAIKLGWAALDTLNASAAIEPLSQAVDQAASASQRAELQFLLALALGQAGADLARQRSLLAEAVPHLGDRRDLLAWALLAMSFVSPDEISQQEDRTWLRRALEAQAQADDRLLRVFVLGKAGSWLVLFGDRDWREVTDRVERIIGDRPQQRREANACYSIGLSACYAGHLTTAERLLTKGLQAAAVQDNRRIEMLLRSGLALFHLMSGAWAGLPEEAAVLLRELDAYALGRVDVELVSGCLALACGDLDQAEQRLEAVATLVTETGATEVLPLAAGAAARVALARGDLAAAQHRLGLLSGAVQAKGCWPVVCWALPSAVEAWMDAGSQDEATDFLGRSEAGLHEIDAPLAPAALAYGRGVLTGSAAELIRAADLYEAVPGPYEAARARERAAGLLVGAGQPDVAKAELKRAVSGYERLGASWDQARATRLARQHGIVLPARHGGGRRSYGRQLSPQESAVAELAIRGHTNKEIAARLFISSPTVDKHMGSVMRKMGTHSRAGLAYRLASADPAGDSKNGEITP